MTASHEYPRRFVPDETDLGDWQQVEPLFQRLLDQQLESVEDLERWLLDESELSACLSEERSDRYIAMTRDTEDDDKERRYLEFIENVVPRAKPWFHRLNEKYVACPHRGELDAERYGVLDREIEALIELFREENIPLQTETAKLSQRYQKLCGAMTVTFRGEERTLPQMARFLEDTDRGVRQEAWELVWERRLGDRERIDDIFDELLELRQQIAANAGFDDYRGYAFKSMMRFDYDIEASERFQRAVAETVVPLARKLADRRLELLARADGSVQTLRPWDRSVDPLGRPRLDPFEEAGELVQGVHEMLCRVDPELAGQFDGMRHRGELDLDSRVGKAPGGYQSTRDESRRPFIFMNAAGMHRDVETLLHESGHAFHALATRDEPLVGYRHAPIEFAEVASMTMELFGDDHLDVFYSEEDAARAKRRHLEGIIELLPWVARIDAFQHRLYAAADKGRDVRTRLWLELEEIYDPGIDWSGHEDVREVHWQRQLHLFVHPFYYIEYGIAQLGALQIWLRGKRDAAAALAGYRRALALGGSRPLPELFEAAGAHFAFDADTIGPLVAAVEEELAGLPA